MTSIKNAFFFVALFSTTALATEPEGPPKPLAVSDRSFDSLSPSEQDVWIEQRKREAETFVLSSYPGALSGSDQERAAREIGVLHERLDQLRYNVTLGNLDRLYRQSQEYLDQLIATGKVISGPGIADKRALLGHGISRTIYSIPYPETEVITEGIWRGTYFQEIFGHPETAKQDTEHHRFIDAYRRWAAPVVQGLDEFQFSYSASGSAEAIKDTLSVIHGNNPSLRLHIFDGDYEGLAIYAGSMGFQVVKHPRTASGIEQLKDKTIPGEYWYISEPSALDGNLWSGYESFMQKTQELGLNVLIDLAYVGTVAKSYKIRVDYPNIEGVFFSLSKPFGAYYQRIGGLFSRKKNQLLQGNVWTKNLIGLRVGEALMTHYGAHDFARRYHWAQTVALQKFRAQTGIPLRASDVITIGYLPAEQLQELSGALKTLVRGDPTAAFFRPCLVPSMLGTIAGMPRDHLLKRLEAPGTNLPCARALGQVATVEREP